MSETQVRLTIDDGVARVTLETESGLNVLSGGVLDRIADAVAKVRAADVRFMVLGATGKVFVAGANIKELRQLDAAGAAALSHRGNKAFDAIADSDFVSVARLQGAALGGGLELAMACDFRVAVREAKIGLPETSLGLIPGWRGTSRMIRLAGLTATKRLIFSAGMISADEGRTLGIVDEVVEDEGGLDGAIGEMIKALSRGGPHACAMVKKAIRTGDETAAFAECFDHAESTEGITAFLDKRKASWMQ